jgi:hypothetical protein
MTKDFDLCEACAWRQLLQKIIEWYETADRSAQSWAELDKIMENQDDNTST